MKYADAKLKYQEAHERLPTETYPQDQLRKCDQILKED